MYNGKRLAKIISNLLEFLPAGQYYHKQQWSNDLLPLQAAWQGFLIAGQ